MANLPSTRPVEPSLRKCANCPIKFDPDNDCGSCGRKTCVLCANCCETEVA